MKTAGRRSKRLALAVLLAAPATLLASVVLLLVMMAAATGAMPVNLPSFSSFFEDSPDVSQSGDAYNSALPKEVIASSDPAVLRPISRKDAVGVNAAIAISADANPAASRFMSIAGDVGSWARSLECLTAAVYYEAASESIDGQRAVAQVVLNRVRHPAYPHTVCGVVFQGSERRTGCQFTFTCDGSLRRTPSSIGWARAQGVAGAALGGYVFAPVGWSTHYHTDWVVPYWASTLMKTAVVGAHIFYRWDARWGHPEAFISRYAGAEPALDWRGKDNTPNGGVGSDIVLFKSIVGQPIAQIKDRPILVGEGGVVPRSASLIATAAQKLNYIRADSRWVLGGVQPPGDTISSVRKNVEAELVVQSKRSIP